MSYDPFAKTFSKSRQNHPWPEVDYFIDIIHRTGARSILDIGCGNGRFIEEYEKKIPPHFSSESYPPSKSGSDSVSRYTPLSEGGCHGVTGGSVLSPSERRNHTMTGGNENMYYLGIDNSSGMIDEAKRLHPEYHFEVCDMLSLSHLPDSQKFDTILLLASFHHLKTREERLQVLRDMWSLLTPGGQIMMTNWNLRDQPRYEKSHRGSGDYEIKIGEYTRYYHGFTVDELEELYRETGYTIIENQVFEGGRNIVGRIRVL